MPKIIECIPNFSEGRNKKKIQQIVKAITKVEGIILLGAESDSNHNRSVISFAGIPESVLEAAFQAVKKASELIDMSKHKGVHPRMGATDVCPLVPIKGVSMAKCVKFAEKLGERIGKELHIPVYLYEKAAHRKERQNLANIRSGEYEGIKKEISHSPSRKPDFGPLKLGKAGATAVGAREPLIAYNINLATNDLEIAKSIAKTIREKDGGLKKVKALGLRLKNRGIVQVSMNLTNYKKTGIYQVFKAVQKEAQKLGVKILESEIIGLVPAAALKANAKKELKITNFSQKQILERALKSPN